MDRGKRKGNLLGMSNSKIYMDLKDIIREHALAYLPAKSLMRFKSVCRDWKLQIASPFFVHNQSLCCRSVSGLFCQTRGEPALLVPFDAKSCGVPEPSLSFLPETVEIRSSSNGLLCCQSPSGAYYICNPVTKHWKKLPTPNADHGSIYSVVLAFEPSLLNFVAEYKLVCVFCSNDFEDAIEFEIYNSVENSWKISGEMFFRKMTQTPSSAVCVNNVVYWKLAGGNIISYDIVKDRSQELYAPSYSSGNAGTLGIMNGKLGAANSSNNKIFLHVLANEHTNTMQMSSSNAARMWESKEIFKNIAGEGHQNVVFASGDMLVLENQSKLSLYSLKDNSLKELVNLVRGDRSFFPYVSSLVSI